MKERPILFSAPMVRAILADTKTQTRRVMSVQPPDHQSPLLWASSLDRAGKRPVLAASWSGGQTYCRYGMRGERLWVRETHMVRDRDVLYRADVNAAEERSVVRLARKHGTHVPPWMPAIHMPRAASRITLEVTGVRVERLQGISEQDATAEGVDSLTPASCDVAGDSSPTEKFCGLWRSINGAESWAANPWVWCIQFKRVTP